MLGTLNDEQKVNWKNYVAPLYMNVLKQNPITLIRDFYLELTLCLLLRKHQCQGEDANQTLKNVDCNSYSHGFESKKFSLETR
jgi:hypothetical protein